MAGENGIDIERLIPHRLPMRLVEELDPRGDDAAETSSVVRETWPTAEDGQVQSIVLVELVAQSAAALMGWRERDDTAGHAPGLLVGVPRALLFVPSIPVGTRVICTVRIDRGLGGYVAFDGEVRDEAGRRLLEASIQAFRPPDGELAQLTLTGKKEA